MFRSDSHIRPCPVCRTADNVAGVVRDGNRVLYWECWECGSRWHLWKLDRRAAAQAEAWGAIPYAWQPPSTCGGW